MKRCRLLRAVARHAGAAGGHQHLRPAAFGRVYGFVYSGIDVGLACAPIVFGPLMDAGRYSHVLWGVAVLQTLAIATALTVGS